MSAVANIVLNDAQATPVAHTFIPNGPDKNGVWWFEDYNASNAIANNRISIQFIRAPIGSPGQNAGQRTNRVKLVVHTPTLETIGTSDSGITPPPTVAFVPKCTIEFLMSERTSFQARKDLRKYAQFLLADAQIVSIIELLQNIY